MAEVVSQNGWLEPGSPAALLKDLLPDEYYVVDGPVVRGQSFPAAVIGPQGLFVMQTRDWIGEVRPVSGGDWLVVLPDGQTGRYPNPLPETKQLDKAVEAFLKDEFRGQAIPVQHLLMLENPQATLVPAPDVAPLAVLPEQLVETIATWPLPADGGLQDPLARQRLAEAMLSQRFTATQRASQPFIFRSGGLTGGGTKVWTIQEAVNYMDRHPQDGIYHLNNGTLATWLDQQGAPQLAALARDVLRSRETDPRVPLENFLIGTGLVARPKLRVRPRPVKLGCVISGNACSQRVRISKGSGRGYLYGSLGTSEPWLRVEPQEFRGDSAEVLVIANTSSLPISSEPWQADLVIDSSASDEPVSVPVRVRVAGEPSTFGRYVVRPLANALVAGLLGAIVGAALGLFSLDTPFWLANLTTPPMPSGLAWALLVGIPWALLGIWLGLRQRPAWSLGYSLARWLLRVATWSLALGAAAAIGYWLAGLFRPEETGRVLTAALIGVAFAALPATIAEIQAAKPVSDVPVSYDHRILTQPILWAAIAIGVVAFVVGAINVGGPALQQAQAQGQVEAAQEWLGARYNDLDEAMQGLVNQLYLRRYDRRAPPQTTPDPNATPAPSLLERIRDVVD